jgi:aminoglycoside 3-N-acetyltransferase
MAVFGAPERVAAFVAYDAVATAPVPPEGCYGKLYDEDGYVLLVGVGHNRDTFLHCVEEMMDVPNRLSCEPVEKTVIRRDGTTVIRRVHTHVAEGIGDVSARYPKLEPAFRAHGCIVDLPLGNANVQVCSARKMKEVFESIYKKANRQELFLDDAPLDTNLY